MAHLGMAKLGQPCEGKSSKPKLSVLRCKDDLLSKLTFAKRRNARLKALPRLSPMGSK